MDTISTNRLTLTLVSTTDVDFLTELFSFRDVRLFYVLEQKHLDDIKAYTSFLTEGIAQNRLLFYIIRAQNGTPIGIIGGDIRNQRIGGLGWYVGYAIHPLYRGKGYATEALINFTTYLNRFQFHKIILDISVENEASKAVARKAGFKLNEESRHIDVERLKLSWLFHWEKKIGSDRNAYFSQACGAFRAKEYQQAEVLFQKAIEEKYEGGPCSDAQCYSNMGMACSSYGNYDKAFQCLKKAQSLGLNNPSIERELTWLKRNVGL